MNTIVVWLLISISEGSYNHGTVTMVDRFANSEECQRVAKEISNRNSFQVCIQARVVK